MRFAVISPAAGLHEFSSLSSTHLLLSYVKNELYWQYYGRLNEDPNQLTILDNSAYEGKMDTAEGLVRLNTFMPKVYVMPDFLGQESSCTFNVCRDFIKTWRHQLPCELMYVPQFDGTVSDFQVMKKHLQYMLGDFGIKWFGLPRYIAQEGFSRSELCLYIKREGTNWMDGEPYVHALGMMNGSLKEMKELDEAQCDSIDSSAPVWRGWNGFGLENNAGWDLSGTNCDFNVHPNTLTSSNRELIYSNLKKVGIGC